MCNSTNDPTAINVAVAGAVALLIMSAILVVGLVAGSQIASAKFLDACRTGEKFYDLGPTDQPYRCTRVIDYPPTTGDTHGTD